MAACLSGVLCGSSFAWDPWRTGPAISGAAIKKEIDCQWFHIDESCTLRPKGKDVDEGCTSTGWQSFESFINLFATSWSGEGIMNGATGDYVVWNVDRPTGESGVQVTATIRDTLTNGADDPEDATATKQMYAYETIVHMNCTSKDSGSPTVTVSETGDSAAYKNLSLNAGPIASDGEIDTWATAEWVLATNPATATLGTNGQLRADISAFVNGILTADNLYDGDWLDGTTSIDVSIALGSASAVSIGFPIFELGDSKEAAVGAGFGFNSDHLGSDTDDRLQVATGQIDELSQPASRGINFGTGTTRSATFRGQKGATSRARAIVEGKLEIVGDATARLRSHNSTATYWVSMPDYDPGTPPGPEPGYND